MKKKKIYCVYCGKENKVIDLKCKKCNKKLDPKENLFLDYIKDHIKDELKGNIEDKIISIIKNFIVSHLYGSILTATLIFTIVSGIVTNVDKNDNIIKVTEKPTIMVGNIDKCDVENSKKLEFICEDGYNLEDDTCIKEEEIDADINYLCVDNYSFNGSRCISNITIDKIVNKECLLPEGENYLSTRIENDTCLVEVCAGWTDGECSAGGFEEIPFTITEYCPNGTTEINGECKYVTDYDISYSCEDGTLEEDKCIIEYEEEPELSCGKGYTLNEECNLCVLGD